jgi:hypothetical protein
MWTYPSFYAFSLLHSSDFENKFVCGEIMTYEDLREHGSETAVKAAGKLRQQGKPYESEFLPFFFFWTNADGRQWWMEILLTGKAVNEIDCQEVVLLYVAYTLVLDEASEMKEF